MGRHNSETTGQSPLTDYERMQDLSFGWAPLGVLPFGQQRPQCPLWRVERGLAHLFLKEGFAHVVNGYRYINSCLFISCAQSFVELVNMLLSASSSSSGHGHSQSASTPSGLGTEIARSMTDASMLPALVRALQAVDLNHPSAPKIVNSILKPMEVRA